MPAEAAGTVDAVGQEPRRPLSALPGLGALPGEAGRAFGMEISQGGGIDVPCAVSSFETQEVGTLRCSLRFCWLRESFVSEWSWQEKRKRALPEGNPPGISCRRLIPMSAGGIV